MGLAIAGQIPSGIAIAGQKPSGLAIAGNNIFAGGASWQLLSQANVTGMGMQSMTLDTTGANLLVFLGSSIGDTFYYDVADNQGNTWVNAGKIYTAGRNPNLYLYYCIQPNTNTQHTVQAWGDYKAFIVAAFKGPDSIGVDQFTYTNVPGTPISVQIPAITPASQGLVFAGAGLNSYDASIDSGFTIIDLIPRSSVFGAALAYLINKNTNPISPSWIYSGGWNVTTGDNPVTMINFIGA